MWTSKNGEGGGMEETAANGRLFMLSGLAARRLPVTTLTDLRELVDIGKYIQQVPLRPCPHPMFFQPLLGASHNLCEDVDFVQCAPDINIYNSTRFWTSGTQISPCQIHTKQYSLRCYGLTTPSDVRIKSPAVVSNFPN